MSRNATENRVGNHRQANEQGEMTIKPIDDFVVYLREYAREKPEQMALWCLGIGFILGWRLKPW
jgi:hypothetical protein